MSAMISQTLQGAALSVLSNVLAQIITAYRNNTAFTLNPVPILKFAFFSILSNPPNILWQNFLEESFPTQVRASRSEKEKADGKPAKKTSAKNVLVKFLLDQTFGALVNNLMFLAYMGYMNAPQSGKVGAWGAVETEVRTKLYSLFIDGAKVWPLFSLASFLWIPVEKRIVAGCAVGVLWGIYLSLIV